MRLVASCYMRLAPSCKLLQAHRASTHTPVAARSSDPASTHTHTLAPLINMEARAEENELEAGKDGKHGKHLAYSHLAYSPAST